MKKVLKFLGGLLLTVLILAVGLIGYLSLTEYNPDPVTGAEVLAAAEKKPDAGQTYTLIGWNIGYGALGDNADFFMDGGTMVMSADKARVEANIADVAEKLKAQAPDILFLQETDISSRRSYKINETEYLKDTFAGCSAAFAANFRTAFVPYPLPPIGKVDSGLLTLSSFAQEKAERVALPCPFSWPIRTVNLKRCLLVSRVPVEGSDKELVLINLHLEAYDDGEGKIAQTRMLKEYLETEVAKGNYVIAGGDFNQTFTDVDLSPYPLQEGMWAPGLIDVADFAGFQCLMSNEVPSCRSLDRAYAGTSHENFQYYVIDGFIVSPNITVESFEVLDMDFVSSDHNPTKLVFTLQ